MLSRKKPGFTLAEMLVSVAVIGILAVIMVVNLNSGKRTEQLSGAARQLAADIRGMQSRALSAGDIKACLNASADLIVCENSTADCADPAQCLGMVPDHYGLMVTTTAAGYSMFVEYSLSGLVNQHMDYPDEQLARKRLLPIGSQDIEISQIELWSGSTGWVNPDPTTGSVVFSRQSGQAKIFDAAATGAVMGILKITLRHKISNETLVIEVNRATGRVSIL